MSNLQQVPEDHLEEYELDSSRMLNLATFLMVSEHGILAVRDKKHTDTATALALIVIARELTRLNQ